MKTKSLFCNHLLVGNHKFKTMISFVKKLLKRSIGKTTENQNVQTSYLLSAFFGFLEEVLFWKKTWISLYFISLIHLVIFVCFYQQVSFLQFMFCLSTTMLIMDAFEAWLKYKHRMTFLKSISEYDGTRIKMALTRCNYWTRRKFIDYVDLREDNPAKAFLVVNIVLGTMFIVGKYMNGYLLAYALCMLIAFAQILVPKFARLTKRIRLIAESDGELEGLIPDLSDSDIKLLSIDPDPVPDDRHSLDWKPEDLPIGGDVSDSSDTSSSLETNISNEKIQLLDKDIETSDSDEEYTPLVQKELQSTLEIVQPTGSWGGTAYNALASLTGAVSNMVYAAPEQQHKKNTKTSSDSSDGFEFIDKNEFL